MHQQIDRELNAIRSICSECSSPVVILEELDCLMTYLSIYGQKELLWHGVLTDTTDRTCAYCRRTVPAVRR